MYCSFVSNTSKWYTIFDEYIIKFSSNEKYKDIKIQQYLNFKMISLMILEGFEGGDIAEKNPRNPHKQWLLPS